jgi:hypothetical protein
MAKPVNRSRSGRVVMPSSKCALAAAEWIVGRPCVSWDGAALSPLGMGVGVMDGPVDHGLPYVVASGRATGTADDPSGTRAYIRLPHTRPSSVLSRPLAAS